MRGSRYKLLGMAVWHGGRWYVRRRARRVRMVGQAAVAAGGVAAAGIALARRLAGRGRP